LFEPDLFSADIPDPEHPLSSIPRRPPPNVPLSRTARDTVEDALEASAPDGISWAWDVWPSPYVDKSVHLIVSDCRTADGMTLGLLLNDDAERDARNLADRIAALDLRARPQRQRRPRAA
jgi:hypothetical protein